MVWSKSFGDDAPVQHGHRVATSVAGDVYVTGDFDGTIDFGGGALASNGGTDVFLAKLGPDGTYAWAHSFGDGLEERAHGLAVRPNGDVVLTGRFQGTIDFGGQPLVSAGDSDAFLAIFDASGAHLCSTRFGGTASDMGADVAAEEDGDVVLVGMFQGTMQLGATMVTSGGARDAFFARLGGCSLFQSGTFPGAGGDFVWSVASIGGSQMIFGMDSDGTLDFGGGALQSAGEDDVFVPRLAGDGSHVWSRRFGDVMSQWAPHVAVSSAEGVLGAASFAGVLDMGPAGAVTSAGMMDAYVFLLDGSGNPVWVRGYGDAAMQRAEEIDVDASGRVLVVGRAEGTTDFGGGPKPSGGGEDAFVLVLDEDGEHVLSLVAGDAGQQSAWGIAADTSGNAFFTGEFEGVLDLGAGPMTSNGGADVFVAKLKL